MYENGENDENDSTPPVATLNPPSKRSRGCRCPPVPCFIVCVCSCRPFHLRAVPCLSSGTCINKGLHTTSIQ
jgi:hypothetical protein